jgi:hypothetical protein
MSHEWKVGDKVAYYHGYSRAPSSVATVEKIYKSGHLIIRGNRFAPYGDGYANQTGGGYSRASVRLLTPELKEQIRKHRKVQRIRAIGDWMTKCKDADAVPDMLLLEWTALTKETVEAALGIEDEA